MTRALTILLSIAVLAGVFAPTVAAAPSPQVERLQVEVKRLHHQLSATRTERNRIKQERNVAWDSIALGLPAQVAVVASTGSIGQLAQAILEPIRINWPCGASVYQGQTFWSLDVDLRDLEPENERTCSP